MKTFGFFNCGDLMIEKVDVGSKLWLNGEKQGYTVRASNRFYSICTKPLNCQKTVLYTIIDWHNKIMGTENLVFGFGAETDEQCKEMLDRITNAESDISRRNCIKLIVDKYKLSNFKN